MAKAKADVNKSAEIRGLFLENPGATGKEIVAKLKEQGIIVSEGLVYSLKPGKKKKKAGPKMKAKAAAETNGALPVGTSIAIAKAAAFKVGGRARLKELVDALQ